MKNLQICFLKIICASVMIFCASNSKAQNEKILRADSLFKAKQYTQSFEVYQSVFNEKKYSPAMLLKMAYINEGLGKIGATLYFLKLYQLATDDDQSLKKAEELASKYKLAGYETNDANRLMNLVSKNMIFIQLALTIVLFVLGVIIFIQRKKNQNAWGAVAALVLVAAGLFYSNNFEGPSSVVASNHKTYLMTGPSAGSAVAGIIDEGTLLQSSSQEDVWIKVKWLDKDLYVKENAVLKVCL
jgi:hypothetical protein